MGHEEDEKRDAMNMMLSAGHEMLPWYIATRDTYRAWRANCYRCNGYIRVYRDYDTGMWQLIVHAPVPCTGGK
jgi:hypothetical protein